MKTINLLSPKKVVFGNGCSEQFTKDFISLGYKKVLIITTPPILQLIDNMLTSFKLSGIEYRVLDSIINEPTKEDLNYSIKIAREFKVDSIIGIGGGSALDVAKLVAALHNINQKIEDVFGIGNLSGRNSFLACLPTTAGTGSEVSPNAIILDETDNLKKGVISEYLIPDVAYIDPLLTLSVPANITASTGMDALTHCLEAYTNKFAHPIIDMYALEGIKLISDNLVNAYLNGKDENAREQVALGSLFGGMCLGPVNTAGVHALSYPLGGEYHIAHGLSNALLLPYVMQFNYSSSINKYSNVAKALGSQYMEVSEITAEDGIRIIFNMIEKLDLPTRLSQIDIPKEAIDKMSESAMTVTRLLKNNPREITITDAKNIYMMAY
ncbi:MAG: iron-containing alcohol dehydrogenase [Ignavibacteriales bacterium]|nr:iron-containing alcohol dehydrogenase [Ignavibacteriales bacterium]MCB9219693.1 iron-containing alcohol dehydrogenase [Ignavibacteriales bacterium]MCB9259827.1 iron-containing alcohol dehydrogenase [Ignavibacteriales bacterium]